MTKGWRYQQAPLIPNEGDIVLLPDHVTWETGIDEPLHPDPAVASRFIEFAMSNCENGCKIYGDPLSRVTVVGHYSVYGCTKTRLMLDLRVLV